MKASLRIIASLFLLAFLAASCQTAKKYVESGDYDGAIDLCIRKLRGKDNKKTEYVQGLELAFKKAQERDLATTQRLIAENRPEHWERIHDLHVGIRTRQHKIMPFLPLVSKKGYKAHFQLVEITELETESRAKAAEYLYNQATTLIGRGEKGDKLAARKAFDLLHRLEDHYYRDYRDKTDLLAKACDLGTSYVLVDIKNQSGKNLPRGFSDRLLSISKQELDSEWKVFFFDAKPGEQFDYKAVFNIRNIDISPERVNERSYFDEKQVQDGWEYVLDKRGNVVKDSLGNDVKRAKFIQIRAEVLEVHQTKAARLTGDVEIFDLSRSTAIDRQDLATEILFEHFAATFRGDERALSKESRLRIGNSPVPFPRDEDMLVQAAERLKPNLKEELRGNRAIL